MTGMELDSAKIEHILITLQNGILFVYIVYRVDLSDNIYFKLLRYK